MNLAFLGTPEFAVPSLRRLQDSGHEVRLVLTQPDRPSGRGRHLQQSPVKREALARRIPVFQPERLDAGAVERVGAVGAEAIVVVAYGLILPSSLLHLPPRGCINVHASLLPRYRGAAPVAHAIFRGETRTGVTTLLMDEGIDTGPLLLQSECPVGEEETAGDVETRLAEMGAELLLETLQGLLAGRIQPRPQEIDRETYAPKIRPEAAWIAWGSDAVSLVNQVRGLNPRPGAVTTLGSRVLKVWRVARGPGRAGGEAAASPGTVLACEGVPRVACGRSDSLLLLEIQMEGRRRVTGQEAARGRWFHPGDLFGEGKEPTGKEPGSATSRL